ncbi:hypothetical protein M917_0840 [Psychrobacter aquaticus CMS 56]|uniref:Uncharacterized protein n=1 Tax=Psychrobacter aquaticus CMS 56 TaxID=1354303 RepID=U4T490_9GAMM|nr:hypothetical protein M917_0840 [Psychrobacter aquaticus CMS 56]
MIGLSIWFNILWLTVVSVIAGAIFCGAVSKLEGHKNNLREKLYQLS